MVPVAAPAARRASWYWADLIRGERGGSRVAAEERGEMGDAAASGAVGPELPDLVVLEIGVAEISQGRPLGAECARGRCRRAGTSGRVGRVVSCGSMDAGPSFPAATGRDRPSTFALVGATGKGNVQRRRHGDVIRGVRAGIDAPICQDTPSGGLDDLLTSAEVGHDALVNLSREEAFQAADDVAFGPASGDASGDVVAGRLVEWHPGR